MSKIICIAAEKGGVGKTTLAVNLASIMAQDGNRVLVVDMDAQANATWYLTGYKKRQDEFKRSSTAEMIRTYSFVPTSNFIHPTQIENVSIIPATDATAHISDELDARAGQDGIPKNHYLAYCLQDCADDFDFIIIDTPPSLQANTCLSLVASDYLITPYNCTETSLEGLINTDDARLELERTENAEIELLGIVLTMAQKNKLTSIKKEEIENSERYGRYVFNSTIRYGVAVKESETIGQPLVVCAKETGPAKDMVELYHEICSRLST